MHAEDFLINDSCDRKAVEAVSKCFPEFDVIPSLALVIEPINSINGGAFVVSS